MNSRYIRLNAVAFLCLVALSSCISPADQFKNTTDPRPVELRSKSSTYLQTTFSSGTYLFINDIDGKTTAGDFRGVPEPYMLSPGKHLIGVSLSGAMSSWVGGFLVMDFKAGNKYTLRGRRIGQVFVIEVVNTTSGNEVIEKSIRTMGTYRPTPIYTPIVVPS
jgi:hypothetical protein